MATTIQSDNGALFFGALFGTHKFVPAVSPKKTLEGVFGAIFMRYYNIIPLIHLTHCLSVATGFFISLYKNSGFLIICFFSQ